LSGGEPTVRPDLIEIVKIAKKKGFRHVEVNTSFLFTADAEADAEQSMLDAGLDLQSDVLKVGHHGSRSSTTQPFLDGVAPSYAIISAGENNSYGHPHQETIERLLAKVVTVYGTFRSGTIIASTDGTSVVFQDSPEPIPEFQSGIILLIFMVATLLAVIVYKGKHLVQQLES